MVIDSKME